MSFRSTDTKGRIEIPANAALLGYRLAPDMGVADALEVFDTAININEWAAAVRRHPSWNPALEDDIRFRGEEEWPLPDLYFARRVLIRALRAFGTLQNPGLTRFRDDGRIEVADSAEASHLYCQREGGDWCILDAGHPGECNEDRELWLGPDVLYPVGQLAHA